MNDEKVRRDAARWRFTRDNSVQYFEPTGLWTLRAKDGFRIAEGYANSYEDAVDRAMAAADDILGS